jgi:diacylglycerol kinase family enzyme
LQPRATAEAMLKAHVRRIDLGRAGDRYFLLMAGVGFDAAVVSEVRSEEKRRLGILAYALRLFDVAWRYRGTRARIILDGRMVRGHVLLVVMGNSQLYGGIIKITNRASLDDGLLDVCIIRGTSLWSVPERALNILLGRHSYDPEMEYHRARTVYIDTRRVLPVQVDGDEGGFTPMVFQSAPGALYALLPPSLPPALLRNPNPPPRRRLRQRMFGWLGRWRGR